MPSLRELTGHDKPVADYVLSSKGAKEFLDAYEKAIEIALEGYAQEDKHYVTIAVGCTGGQHRSVAMSEELARRLRAHAQRNRFRERTAQASLIVSRRRAVIGQAFGDHTARKQSHNTYQTGSLVHQIGITESDGFRPCDSR